MSKFKVGDKVCCYSVERASPNTFIGYISAVGENGLVLTKDGLYMVVDAYGAVNFFHPKQCRKLVNKKKSQFICPYCGSNKGNILITEMSPRIDYCNICRGLPENKLRHDKINISDNKELKVGDFVSHKDYEFVVGQVSYISKDTGDDYPIKVTISQDILRKAMYWWFSEDSLLKLNIK